MNLALVFPHTFPIQFSFPMLAHFPGNGHLILSWPDGMKGVLSEPLKRDLRKAGQHKTLLPFPLTIMKLIESQQPLWHLKIEAHARTQQKNKRIWFPKVTVNFHFNPKLPNCRLQCERINLCVFKPHFFSFWTYDERKFPTKPIFKFHLIICIWYLST